MVNYKRVVCEVAVVAALLTVTTGAPTPECADKHYDQRQNGTENYRLNIDGVVIAVAPAQSLLEAATDIDISDLLDLYEMNELEKPKPPSNPISIPEKPENTKPQESKPESPEKPAETPLSDVSLNADLKPSKKDALTKKHEKTQRLKARLAHILLPLLRKNRHH
ncbi:uncharacterized protein LOC113517621 [Galleria mellonella]|uniref:Uncharacterized protein LOC113517621 n=1 Tax=Galleria mellonella TaxID=7137 RepID=A0A6J1WRK2_GALME|nr:uncharacterized protein LOC113517621 [Galleria mellonella]